MAESPFPFHGPLAPERVRGRDDIIAELVERITDRRPTVLVAPRRFGKTSVLGAVTRRLADTTTAIWVDLYELRSWADLAARLDDALTAVTGDRRRLLDRLAAGLELNLGVVKASLSRPERPEPDITADRLLDLLVRYAASHPTVVVFDEFSSIVGVTGAAGLLRTRLQHHYRDIGLVFAGSEPSTMRLLFTGADQPFYAQADLVELPPLSLAALTEIIDEGFSGAPPPGLAARIHAFTQGHPQRSMQVADAAWTAAQEDPDADPAVAWAATLERVRRTTADGHETRFTAATPPEQSVLRLIATGQPLFGRAAELLATSRSSTQLARDRLAAAGVIANEGGVWSVVDPLYADWIRTRFPL